MRRLGLAVVAVSAVVAACAAGGGVVLAAGAAVPVAGVRGVVAGAPGLGVLNTGGHARVTSVSCPSAGNCVAVGHYRDRHGEQGFVAGERHGIWGRAIGVPGLAALNTGGRAEINSVSCPSAGNCVAGGFYQHSFFDQGFVATERHGAWGRAIEVPGLAALGKGGETKVYSVSCAPAGDCTAGGIYTDRYGLYHGFAATERDGRWGTAIQVPGLGP